VTAGTLRPRLPEGWTISTLMPAFVIISVTLAVLLIPYERSPGSFPDGDLAGTISFFVAFLTAVGIFAIMTLGLNIQWGYTGVFNFGVLGFFMIGAYTAAIITKEPSTSEFTTYVGGYGKDLDIIPALRTDQWFPFLVGTAAAGLAAGLLALLLSIPTLRLREDYLAIATIGFAELLRRIVIQEDDLVNGTRGLPGVPHPLSDLVSDSDYKYVLLAIVVAVLLLVYFALERGVRSPWGRVLIGLREDEQATEAAGKNVFAFKTQSFVLGAVIMGIGGSMYAYAYSSISPEAFTHFFATFLFWAMLIIGGSGNNKGAIAGAYVLWGFWTISLQVQGYDLGDTIQTRMSYFREMILGLLIVGVLLLRPNGLLPQERRVSLWVERMVKRMGREPSRPPPVED
jgi:branched-chain amino acid transport system permease protein